GHAGAVANRCCADGRTCPDIRREHRRKNQPGPELPPRHEEIAAAAHAPADVQTNTHQHERVDDKDDEMKTQVSTLNSQLSTLNAQLPRSPRRGETLELRLE